MVIDKLENGKCYYGLGVKIQRALEYLSNINLTELEAGNYQIENNDVYAMVSEYETKSMEGVLWEAHKRYIDVQYMIKGSEKMGYTNVDNIKVTIDYDSKKDILFGTANGDFVTVQEGMFIIFTPEDGHMPSINVEKSKKVKKVVVKVLAD
ncbi:YhcH/YjgK/YiaL family protein [Clostridium chromiireducens]|uniref:Toxin-antitoxin biofilm protein TabA n=1 Tax=Clostridium chromiireducens TaxID=225345 RepID=A0A1V4IRJ7_9CLOT|nr:YhcH/YjgK/YiaL family protein [Clostridium chromiireducens]OPJ62509.1 toxin-antitoxin biofilm protein TabA [Clostridium chromiireducens]